VNRSGLPERDGRRFGAPGRPPLGTAAKTIGVTEEELLDQLRDGKSIADVAKAKGKDPADVVKAMVTDMSRRIDQAVKDGRVSADDAKQRRERLQDAVTTMVNQDGLPARFRHPGPGDPLKEPARPR
jgi:hypothetical protein